jgi:FKBP-type peptidyl-prolyl cis-trans isomerase FkpA
MNRSRKIAIVVSVLALAGLAAHAQVEPVSGTTPAAAPGPVKAADGSETWPSGLVFRSLREGSGASPSPTDTVKVHYRGTFPDGKEFDSSYTRGQPAEFPLNRVIPCWTEGVQKLKVGGKAKLTCPPAIAYGAKGAGGVIPPNATLNFDVELIGIAGR